MESKSEDIVSMVDLLHLSYLTVRSTLSIQMTLVKIKGILDILSHVVSYLEGFSISVLQTVSSLLHSKPEQQGGICILLLLK